VPFLQIFSYPACTHFAVSQFYIYSVVYSSDGHPQCNEQIPNYDTPVFQNHLLQSCCLRTRPLRPGSARAISVVDEICVLLGYNAASCGNCLPTFRENLSVPSSKVKSLTLYPSTHFYDKNQLRSSP
jgi:hypothetical protein